jgi:hypothetical protein
MKRLSTITILSLFGISFITGLHAQVNESDSLTLVTFYHALDGDNWVDNTGWLTATPVSEWEGITVEGDRVVSIYLRQNNMVGVIPPEIGQLTELRTIHVYQSGIQAPLPESLAALDKLEVLMLQGNLIGGPFPAVVTELESLRALDLYANQFTGALPDLSGLVNLEELVIGANALPGEFPTWMLSLEKLSYAHLGYLGLTGEVPPGLFANLPALHSLVLTGNALGGDIAKWFQGSVTLGRFEISNNDFYGELPNGVVDPEVSRWSVDGNDLTGIPDFSSVKNIKNWFHVKWNRLGFHELEKGLTVETPDNDSRRTFGPQKPLLEQLAIIAVPGDSMTFTAGSWSLNDTYQWYKDGEAIPGATGYAYHIESYTLGDAGVYHCVISHPDFEFDLERSAITVETEGVSAVSWIALPDISLHPNPASDHIAITGGSVYSVEVIDLAGRRHMTSSSTIVDISDLNPGIYVASILTDSGITTRPFVRM